MSDTAPTVRRERPSFSIPSIIAIIAAIAIFFTGGIVAVLLTVVAVVCGVIGMVMALLPSVRGGIVSILSVVIAFIAVVVSIFQAIF